MEQNSVQPTKETMGRNKWDRSKTLYITTLGVLAALSIAMMYMMQIPLMPAAPYLLYDMADIPILIATLFMGPLAGIILTVVVSFIQGVTINASGSIIGVVMHIVATGAFVLTTGLLRKVWTKRSALPIIFGALAMTIIMIPLNLILTPLYTGMSVQEVAEMIVPIVIPFNFMKAGINGLLTFVIYQILFHAFPRLLKNRQG